MSPFKALYGHDPLHILKGSTIPSCLEEVNKLTIVRNELLATLKRKFVEVSRYHASKCQQMPPGHRICSQ